MNLIRRVTTALPMAVLAACMSPASKAPPLTLPLLERSTIAEHAGDYHRFIARWTGSLPTKTFAEPSATMPTDARRVAVADAGKTMERQRRVILTNFEEWCRESRGTGWPRGDDMVAYGATFAVCELKVTGERIAAMRVQTESEAARAGRNELLLEHWTAPDIERYIRERRAAVVREETARQQEMAQRAAAEKVRKDDLKAREKAVLDRMATAVARSRTTPACQRFERESNAVMARFTVVLNRQELRRHTADLAVALDECTSARRLPADDLISVYRFNLQNLQLLGEVWDARLMPACPLGITCNVQEKDASTREQQEMGELQTRYPGLRWMSSPERVADITNRVLRFVVDR